MRLRWTDSYETATRNLEVAREHLTREEESAAARAQMYVRRLTVGDAGLYSPGQQEGGAGGSSSAACSLPRADSMRRAEDREAAEQHEAELAGRAGRKSLTVYTDGGSAAAVAMQVGSVRHADAPKLVDEDDDHPRFRRESTTL
jgi:hypothetical protein